VSISTITLFPLGLIGAALALTLSGIVQKPVSGWLKWLGGWSLIGALAVLAWNSVSIVRPGTVKVQVLHGTIAADPIVKGPKLTHPLAHFQEMVVRRQSLTYEGAFAIRTQARDGTDMLAELTVPFELNPAAAPAIYHRMGGDAVYIPAIKRLVRAAVSDAISSAPSAPGSTARDRLLADMETRIAAAVVREMTLLGFPETDAPIVLRFYPIELTAYTRAP